MSVRIHPTAIIEEDVTIGEGSSIWDNVHIRFGTKIGQQCIVGGKTIIAYEVQIGNRVKINSAVYICHGVTLEDGVMVSAGTVFTNDRCPRATTPDLQQLNTSEPDEHTLLTRVCAGATIGANCTIGNDLTIGRFAMIGMGSVVTRSVPDFHLVVGNPARSVGCVCRCGAVLQRFDDASDRPPLTLECPTCRLRYQRDGRDIAELDPPAPDRLSAITAAVGDQK
jgi:UDP-2-acetamido-3-amino-2,3-dideoxy-glucuronate N-acetyltransferase